MRKGRQILQSDFHKLGLRGFRSYENHHAPCVRINPLAEPFATVEMCSPNKAMYAHFFAHCFSHAGKCLISSELARREPDGD